MQEGSREAQRKAGWWGSGDPGVPDANCWVKQVVWSLLESVRQAAEIAGLYSLWKLWVQVSVLMAKISVTAGLVLLEGSGKSRCLPL